jgi:hypothetical protein
MQLRILIGGAWDRDASVTKAVSALKATEIFHLDQNAITHYFHSICDAAETGKANEPDGSQSPINKTHARSSSTNSGAPRHTGYSKPPVTLSEVLNQTGRMPYIPVKKITEKHVANVFTYSEFIKINKN